MKVFTPSIKRYTVNNTPYKDNPQGLTYNNDGELIKPQPLKRK